MTESKVKTLPQFDSLDELVEFVDENDISEYLDEMPEVEFEVNPNLRSLILIKVEFSLFNKIRKIAKLQGLGTEELINQWLEEKLAEIEKPSQE
jgi:predicted DNA binding CopG/RHH family protein